MFRHHFHKSVQTSFRPVFHTILKETVENGIVYSRPVTVPAISTGIPNPEDYRLHDLIDAGIPLNPVSPYVSEIAPSSEQIDHIVSTLCDETQPISDNPGES